MYEVIRNGRTALEADACGIGFLATRRGIAERRLVEHGLELCTKFDHRGAPGHGAGVLIDIPWALLLDRFPEYAKVIAQRDAALGMFFLPFDAAKRRECVATIEELAELAGAHLLAWGAVPTDPSALPADSDARRTMPVIRQALIARPKNMSEDEWFACRYLLRIAIDEQLSRVDETFAIASLSNRTVTYKGLVELSKIGRFYPDLRDPSVASRFLLFHSRYCTNTTTAWRRSQPFWAIAHNGEIATIDGNVSWMNAIGRDLLAKLAKEHPSLGRLAARIVEIVCGHGSDSANLDDMVIALTAGGMSLGQAILALLPEASSAIEEGDPLEAFYRAMRVFIGACDGPAAIVACDGTTAAAHLDRNGLRPLWLSANKDFVLAASEVTTPEEIGPCDEQRILGPGSTVLVNLDSGQLMFKEQAHAEVARQPFPDPSARLVVGGSLPVEPVEQGSELTRLKAAFGMTSDEEEATLDPLIETGKPALGAMGDDAAPAALLDRLPRRPEAYFKLRFAQETSPPIDPARDAWVFSAAVRLGDRSGLWGEGRGPIYFFRNRLLSLGDAAWLAGQPGVRRFDLLFRAEAGTAGLEEGMERVVHDALACVGDAGVILLSDRGIDATRAPLPALRVVSRLHEALVQRGLRHRVAIVADAGVWDIQHCALLVTMGADAVCPWLGSRTAGAKEASYLKGLRSGFLEAMSMMGVTPSSAYCGARLAEAIGLDADLLKSDFGGVPTHIEGIGRDVLDREWLSFHQAAYSMVEPKLIDAGEYRHTRGGRPHANDSKVVNAVHAAAGFVKKGRPAVAGSYEAYKEYARHVEERTPLAILDCVRVRDAEPIPVEQVEPIEAILWRFMAPGMSEGALSEPAHRTVARAFNALYRYCRMRYALNGEPLPPGIGPIANSGEGGFDKARVGGRDGNRSVQYAGGRFTITPMIAACADEAEIKFAQGAKPGKGGQLPGRKVSPTVALRRGCNPGYDLVSPPINHNLYSIEDVKLMLESWRHLNPKVNCAVKFVATRGVEMVCLGAVNAGANRLHVSDGCGGTGASKRVDMKNAGVSAALVMPRVQDQLVEEGVRELVEVSVDGGVQTGGQVLKHFLLGADRVGFGTALMMAIGCCMLRKCNLAGPDPGDPSGRRRLGCLVGVATQDPAFVANYSGKSRNITRLLRYVAQDVRERLAAMGVRSVAEIVGRRDLLEPKPALAGKAAMLDVAMLCSAPSGRVSRRDYARQTANHMPRIETDEIDAADAALVGESLTLKGRLVNEDRCVGVALAGAVARARGDAGLTDGAVRFEHTGAAGHFYAAYCLPGFDYRLEGVAADSCFTAAYGGRLVIVPQDGRYEHAIVGNAFGYGARGGCAYIAGRAGNRFGICLRQNHERGAARIVVEGVQANAFQYMTGGTALVLGPVGPNLGSGLTGGVVYLLDPQPERLNEDYVRLDPLEAGDIQTVKAMLAEHAELTGSPKAEGLLRAFDPARFGRVTTSVQPQAAI